MTASDLEDAGSVPMISFPSRSLPHLLARVFGPPLMVEPARMEVLVASLPRVLAVRGRDGDAPLRDVGLAADPRTGVATIDIAGALVRRAGRIDAESTPLRSYEAIAADLRRAEADPAVRGILLDVDSWGGEVGQAFDLARAIRAVASRIPVWALVNDAATSAAYLLASSATRVLMTETSSVGSIGVMALHRDQSGQDAREGLVYTPIYAGARKVDGNPHAPLSGQAREGIQREVDRLYDLFVDVVAAHRPGLSAAQVRDLEARVLYGPDAVAAGLADAIRTVDEARREFASHLQSRGHPAMDDQTITPGASAPPAAAPGNVAPTPGSAAPAPPVADASNVVRLAIADARAAHADIVAACALAGVPALAADFIRAGTALADVRAQLVGARAAQDAPAIEPHHDGPADAPSATTSRTRVPATITPAEAWARHRPNHEGAR